MQPEQSSTNFSSSDEEPLTLPHFDDETTLQSARPVVPLHEVQADTRTRQRLLLGAALCLAALVGAMTASFVYSRGQSEGNLTTATIPESSSTGSSGFVAPAGEATGAEVDPDAAVEFETNDTVPNRIDNGAAESRNRNIRPTRTQTLSARRQPERVVQPEIQDRMEEDVVAEQERLREQRREARHLRRERRVNEQRSRDELTRIREIFEGTPRP